MRSQEAAVVDGQEAGTLGHVTQPPPDMTNKKCVLSDTQRTALPIKKTLLFQLGVKIPSLEKHFIWEMEGRHRYRLPEIHDPAIPRRACLFLIMKLRLRTVTSLGNGHRQK